MERKMSSSSVRRARFSRRVKTLIQDWSFPLALVLVWSVAVAYTVAIADRQPSSDANAIIAPS